MTKIVAEILRDAALRPSGIKIKGLKVDYDYYPTGAVSKIILSGRGVSRARLLEILNIIYPRDVNVSVRGSEWFDRNPISKIDRFSSGTQAPHASTERLTYTCPAGKLVNIEVLYTFVMRKTAAAPLGEVRAEWRFTPEGESEGDIYTIVHENNTVGNSIKHDLGSNIMLFQGDKLRLLTRDQSTGGTVTFECNYKLTEFDA